MPPLPMAEVCGKGTFFRQTALQFTAHALTNMFTQALVMRGFRKQAGAGGPSLSTYVQSWYQALPLCTKWVTLLPALQKERRSTPAPNV